VTDIAPEVDAFTIASREAEAKALADAGLAPEPDEAPEAQPEAEAGAPADDAQQTLEPPPEEPEKQPERRRDPETGQFLPNEPEQPFLGTYRTREAAEAGIAEKDRYIEQLRQEKAAYEAWYQQQQAEAQRPRTPANFDELLDENPAYAAQLAWQAGDQHAWQQAAQAWDEVAPGAPALFAQNQQLQGQMQQLAQQFQGVAQPVQEQRAQQARVQAWQELSREIPAVMQMPDDEFLSAAQRNPGWAAVIDNDNATAEQWKQAVRTIYLDALHARGAIQQNIQDVARTQAQEAEQARADAFHASSTTTTAQTPASPEQAEAERTQALWAAEQQKWESGWDRPAALEERLERLRGGR
jgi:hypothetical protein